MKTETENQDPVGIAQTLERLQSPWNVSTEHLVNREIQGSLDYFTQRLSFLAQAMNILEHIQNQPGILFDKFYVDQIAAFIQKVKEHTNLAAASMPTGKH